MTNGHIYTPHVTYAYSRQELWINTFEYSQYPYTSSLVQKRGRCFHSIVRLYYDKTVSSLNYRF